MIRTLSEAGTGAAQLLARDWPWLVIAGLVWLIVATALALVIGKGIRRADLEDNPEPFPIDEPERWDVRA